MRLTFSPITVTVRYNGLKVVIARPDYERAPVVALNFAVMELLK